ncbi:MAG: hypothetical protein BWK80_49265, partial [Desulfobacteraceae bacterium IS3]
YIPNTPPASLGDYVWYDTNTDGIQDSSESGIAGVTVNLLDSAGKIISSAATDGSGYYEFTGLAPGDYRLEFIKPAGGYTFSPKIPGDDAFNSDADTVTGKTDTIHLAAGEHNPKIDAGLFIPPTSSASLGDYVWYDVNQNGIQEAGESGVSGVKVNLLNAAGTVIATAMTDNAGYYQFANLVPGSYGVEFVKPAGYTFSPKTQGGDAAKDSNADTATGRTATVTLMAGEHNPTIDAGLYKSDTASLGDIVWYDTNNNGIQDAGEPGVSGVIVKLLDATGAVIGITATDGTGWYEFAELAPGTYAVQFVKPAGYSFSPANQGSGALQDALDSDADTSTGKTANITLTGGEHNPRLDAGVYIPNTLPAALGDRVWYDADHNGIQDAGESGIAGVTVTLKDAAGKVVATTATDGGGSYLFSGLAPGSYTVEFTPPTGYHVSPQNQGGDAAKDSNPDASGKTAVITLKAGESNLTIDAGLYSDALPAGLGDYVWYDGNNNGVQDAGEPGVAGVKVNLLNAAGSVIASADTDSAGHYQFTGLAAGTYGVEFVKPAGYAFSPKNQGTGLLADTFDSDADTATGRTATVTLAAGEYNPTIDAGLYVPNAVPASLGDYVWYDADKNGIQNAGESGIAGVKVNLLSASGGVIASAVTDGSGWYQFTGLVPGSYAVSFEAPAGYHFSPKNQGSDTAKDSNADTATGRTDVITLSSGGHNPTIDAGLYADTPPASLGDVVWYDTNRNGVQDAGESGVAGVTVNLYDKTGATLIASMLTKADGSYQFAGLAPGSYTIGFNPPAGYSFSPANQGADRGKDSNADLNTGRSGVITLAAGENNPTIDAGIYAPTVIRLGDLVWQDRNNDGQPSSGEGIPNVTLNLYDGSGRLIGTTQTDGNGNYGFANLPPGDYRVTVDTGTLPPGVVQFTGQNGLLNSGADALNQRTDNPNLDFGYKTGGSVTASLGDYVWYDVNQNGIQDAGESGVAGVKVNLLNAAGTVIATAITDNTGYYQFANLASGDYIVQFIKPDGYSLTLQKQGANDALDSNADPNTGRTDMIHLTAGEHNPKIDAGIFIPSTASASLGNFVWYDTNNNGIQEPGEPGIADVMVNLLNSAGMIISTTQTDRDGYYQFTGLAAGNYGVEFVKPVGYLFSPQNQGANTDTDSNADTATGRTEMIALASGEHNSTIDAGMYVSNAQPASLGDFVWYDTNNNGIQDPGEHGVSGVTVRLLNEAGVVIFTAITDGSGYYQFTGLAPGKYSVEFVKPVGYSFTPKNRGDGALQDVFDSDADVITGRTGVITLSSGEHNPRIDAGLVILSALPASIGDRVWYDMNQNGIQDSGEPGIPGVTVRLFNPAGEILATAETDSAGNYIFSGLGAGDYIVQVDPVVGYYFTTPAAGSDRAKDSDTDTITGRSPIIHLAAGQQNMTVDSGMYSDKPLASLGDVVWYDANKNGIQEPGESGVGSVMVNLYDKTGTMLLASTRTKPDGSYQFAGLMPDGYIVEFMPPDGYTLSSPNQGADRAKDSNPDASGRSGVITLSAGENNPTIDAGIYTDNPIKLGALVWLDANHDGQPSPGEGLPNVRLNIYDGSGRLIGTTQTDNNGHYIFSNLPTGDYRILLDSTTLPPGVMQFFSPTGILISSADIVNQTKDNMNLNFGYRKDNDPLPPGFIPCSISDFVWLDKNHDGIQNNGEPGIGGVKVNLYNGDGTFITSVFTNENGYYIFPNLVPGSYVVGFDLPSGYKFTPPYQGGNDTVDSNADITTGRTGIIPLDSGQNITTIDAGMILDKKITIGDLVWLDKNGDGLPSPGEGIPGITLILYDGNGNIIKTTVTDDQGHYLFTDIPPGDYRVVVDIKTVPADIIPIDSSIMDLPDQTDDNPDADFGYRIKLTDNPDLTGTMKSV